MHKIFKCVLTTSTWWPVLVAVFSAIAQSDGRDREWHGHPVGRDQGAAK